MEEIKIKAGLAFHVYHHELISWCYDFDGRVEYITENKPKNERKLRLRLLALIPLNRYVPQPLLKAIKAYEKARAANKAGEAYEKVRAAYEKEMNTYAVEIDKLHKELCPGCPWNGHSIFPDRGING